VLIDLGPFLVIDYHEMTLNLSVTPRLQPVRWRRPVIEADVSLGKNLSTHNFVMPNIVIVCRPVVARVPRYPFVAAKVNQVW
jgi:hypothetical protein